MIYSFYMEKENVRRINTYMLIFEKLFKMAKPEIKEKMLERRRN